jgi:hypothetical protein
MSPIKWTKQDVIDRFQTAAMQSISPAPASPAVPQAPPQDRRAVLQSYLKTFKAKSASVTPQNPEF